MSSRENVNGKWNANNISTSALADRSPGFGWRGTVPCTCVCLRTCLCESISERGQGSAEQLNAVKRYYYRGVFMQVRDQTWKEYRVTLVALSAVVVSDASDGVSERCQSLRCQPPLPTPTVKTPTPEVSVAVLACGYQRPVLWGLCNNKLLIERRSQRRPVSGKPSCWKITAARRLA